MYYSFSRSSSRFGDARSSIDHMASASCMATTFWHITDGRVSVLARLDAARETGSFTPARPNCYAHSIHIAIAVTFGPKYAHFQGFFSYTLRRNKLCSVYLRHIRNRVINKLILIFFLHSILFWCGKGPLQFVVPSSNTTSKL